MLSSDIFLLFSCPIITQKPLDRVASNLVGKLARIFLVHGLKVLNCASRLLLRKLSFQRKQGSQASIRIK